MAEIIAVVDEGGANVLLGDAIQTIGTLTKNGGGPLGPFNASYNLGWRAALRLRIRRSDYPRCQRS
jgi:hypothetical protein